MSVKFKEGDRVIVLWEKTLTTNKKNYFNQTGTILGLNELFPKPSKGASASANWLFSIAHKGSANWLVEMDDGYCHVFSDAYLRKI